MAKIPFELMPEELQGWNGDSPLFSELIEKVKPTIIIEIGSWKGLSTVTMAKACQSLGLDTKIYCIDTWEGSLEFPLNQELYGEIWSTEKVFDKFMSNLQHNGVLGMVEPIKSLSKDAEVPNAQLIYIDGDHTYEGVYADIVKYWNNLDKGGIIFGDDFFLNVSFGRKDGYQCGVSKAVEEFCRKYNLNFQTHYNNFWSIQK